MFVLLCMGFVPLGCGGIGGVGRVVALVGFGMGLCFMVGFGCVFGFWDAWGHCGFRFMYFCGFLFWGCMGIAGVYRRVGVSGDICVGLGLMGFIFWDSCGFEVGFGVGVFVCLGT